MTAATITRRTATRAELLGAAARVASAANVTDAYRAARDRRARNLADAERQDFGPIHNLASRALVAADLQLDAALATEREAVRALMELRELGRKL